MTRRHYGQVGFPHMRKCEICEHIFTASAADQRGVEYRCGVCRKKPEAPTEFRKPERGEFNPQPGRYR